MFVHSKLKLSPPGIWFLMSFFERDAFLSKTDFRITLSQFKFIVLHTSLSKKNKKLKELKFQIFFLLVFDRNSVEMAI